MVNSHVTKFLLIVACGWYQEGVWALDVPDIYPHSHHRRRFLSSLPLVAPVAWGGRRSSATALLIPSPPDTVNNKDDDGDNLRTIYQLQSGFQFRNVRLGGGPPLLSKETQEVVVLLHIKAFLSNNQVLFDTRDDNGGGQPIRYTLGSATLAMDRPQFVTPGLDDALVSRGVLVRQGGVDNGSPTSSTKTVITVPPMRQGGIRLVAVPAALAYGNAGVSRYQILTQLNGRLSQPVPRNEPIRYEVEVLRCVPVTIQDDNADKKENSNTATPSTATVQACCAEEVYPCQVPSLPPPNTPQ